MFDIVGFKIYSICKKRSFCANHNLPFHRVDILHATVPTPNKSSSPANEFDSNFVALVFGLVCIFLYGQNIKLEAKSDVATVTERLIIRIDNKFAEQAKTLDELKDLKTQGLTVLGIASFVGIQPIIEYFKDRTSSVGNNVTATKK